jgi:hypothetical protein
MKLNEYEKLMSEACDKLTAAQNEIGRLRAIVRINLMRSCGATHAEVDALLADTSGDRGGK